MEKIDFKILQEVIPGIKPESCKLAFTSNIAKLHPSCTGPLQKASVLILLYKKNNDWHTVYIKRNTYKGHHSGEISFPGGRQDKNENELNTALREVEEEIGISRDTIQLIGRLPSITIHVSRFTVSPFVAYTDEANPIFQPDPTEVEEIIEVPLLKLMSNETLRKKPVIFNNKTISLQSFVVEENQIWGATGTITCMFLQAIKAAVRIAAIKCHARKNSDQ